jgi:hypothetical protein
MTIESFVAVAGVGGVLVALLQILFTVKGIRDQMWIATFSEYTRRYSEIAREVPSELRRPGGRSSADLSEAERDRLMNSVRAYLNLCSEEFYLRKRGLIDKETWAVWLLGMKETVASSWISEAWPAMQNEYSYYPDFCAFMNELVTDNKPDLPGQADSTPATIASH